MKKLFLFMTFILVTSIASAQTSTTFEQIYRNNGSGASGSTWARGATHYSEWTDMTDVDSAWIVVDFPDSNACAIRVENCVSMTGNGVDTVSSMLNSDSTKYYVNATGIASSYSLVGYYVQGFPFIRFKTIWGSGAQQQSSGDQKYRYFIKKFRHK